MTKKKKEAITLYFSEDEKKFIQILSVKNGSKAGIWLKSKIEAVLGEFDDIDGMKNPFRDKNKWN